MEPYLSNKNKEISWEEFEKNIPPRFIKSIEDYLNPKTIHIFENTNSKEDYLIETKPCECYLCKKNFVPKEIVVKFFLCEDIFHKNCLDVFLNSLDGDEIKCPNCKKIILN